MGAESKRKEQIQRNRTKDFLLFFVCKKVNRLIVSDEKFTLGKKENRKTFRIRPSRFLAMHSPASPY